MSGAPVSHPLLAILRRDLALLLRGGRQGGDDENGQQESEGAFHRGNLSGARCPSFSRANQGFWRGLGKLPG